MNKQSRLAFLNALAGHAVDLTDVVRMRFRNPHSLTKLRMLVALGRQTRSEQVIETGTYLGLTARRLSAHFQHVYTVEIDPDLHRKAAAYLRSRRNVTSMLGDGLEALPEILAKPEVTRAVVFLDGHYSGSGTGRGNEAEPAVLELPVLARFRDKVGAIMIDDFRCFSVNDGYPSKSALVAECERLFPPRSYDLSVWFDQLIITAR